MNRLSLPQTILRVASLLAPYDRRAGWLEEWRSEFWYIPPDQAAAFCFGAFQDALWVRLNARSTVRRAGFRLESPLGCAAFLAALAALSLMMALTLPGPHAGPWHLAPRELPGGCFAMLTLSSLLLPAIRLGMGRSPANRLPVPWPGRLRRGIFLALKIALLQPVMLFGFVVLIWIGPSVPVVPQLGITASWILALRWALLDQRRRCPVCLRLLAEPVRIGTASKTFLEWYGAESVCSRGHGLLHSSETSASYSENPRWLGLDDSWNDLFLESAGRRPL